MENLVAINEWDSYKKFNNLKNKNALSALTDDEDNFSNQFKNLNDQSKKSIFEQLFEYKLVKEYIVSDSEVYWAEKNMMKLYSI